MADNEESGDKAAEEDQASNAAKSTTSCPKEVTCACPSDACDPTNTKGRNLEALAPDAEKAPKDSEAEVTPGGEEVLEATEAEEAPGGEEVLEAKEAEAPGGEEVLEATEAEEAPGGEEVLETKEAEETPGGEEVLETTEAEETPGGDAPKTSEQEKTYSATAEENVGGKIGEGCGYARCRPATSEDTFEEIVCQASELKENMMKTVAIKDGEVLMVRQNEKIYAIGSLCTHYGAPLEAGTLGQGRVRCPWHGACFNIATGDIEDFPGLDSLPCFKVSIQDDGGVKIQGLRRDVALGRRIRCKATVRETSADSRTFVCVGGGPASQVCAETLREGGFQGKVIMLSKEQYLPYDRVLLSKKLETSSKKIALRTPNFYKKYDIDLRLGVELLSINTKEKFLEVSTGDKISYDSLFLATGSRARPMSCPGNDLKKIYTLREIEDSKRIAKELNAEKNVVIVGASFIGMECASCIVSLVKSVSVVGDTFVPFEGMLGTNVGERLMRWFEEKGVAFYMTAFVVEALPSEANPSCVGRVKLQDGRELPADVVIAGIGAIPATCYLADSGVKTNENGTVPVNEFMETNIPGVYAGGDIAAAPVLGCVATISHWQLAHYHGRVAGRNMLGGKEALRAVPFFWTSLFGKGIRYTGFAPKYDDVIIHGNLDELDFVAYYCKEDTVLAMASCNNDTITGQFAELLFEGQKVSKLQVKENPRTFIIY